MLEGPVILVGGIADNVKIREITQRTGVELEWVSLEPSRSARIVEPLERRIRNRSVAAVIFAEQFLAHKEYNPLVAATRRADIPVAYAQRAGLHSLIIALRTLDQSCARRILVPA
jgi:hypothetical protein